MTPDSKLGYRQVLVLRQMARSGGRWPVGWVLRGTEKTTMATLVDRQLVQSLEEPVLTTAGRNIAFWL